MDNYTWEYIQKHPQETKRLLGIDYNQLIQLIDVIMSHNFFAKLDFDT